MPGMASNSFDNSAGSPVLSSVSDRQRVLALDVIRGFAILGILLVNVSLFSGVRGIAPMEQYPLPLGADELLGLFVSVIAEGKFITTLSFLFGLGFTLQAMRAEERGASSRGLLLRRVLGLGLIGIAHAVFIWSGDILFTYALLGLVLILFRNRRPKTLLVWAGCLFGVPLLSLVAATAFTVLLGGQSSGAGQAGTITFFGDLEASAMEAYNSGSYPQMVLQRLKEIAVFAIGGLSLGPVLFAMMLAGAAVARSGWLEGWVQDLDTHGAFIRYTAVLGLGVGIPLNAVYAVSLVVDPAGTGTAGAAGLLCWYVGGPALTFGYMASLTLLSRRDFPNGALRRLAAVGRLALTNYLMQSVVMTAIFYGLAIYGRVRLIEAMLVALALLAVQLALSPIYLRRFRHGPVEWLWRRLTYGGGKSDG